MDLFQENVEYRCCKHCVTSALDCDPKDPGHGMPCPETNCLGAKTR